MSLASVPSPAIIRGLPPVDGRPIFLAYDGGRSLRFAGFLICKSDIHTPIALCAVPPDVEVATATWRLETMRQYRLAVHLATAKAIDRDAVGAIWLDANHWGAKGAPRWLLSLACVPLRGEWNAGFLHPTPFCATVFEDMACRPEALQWLRQRQSDNRVDEGEQVMVKLTPRLKQVLSELCNGLSEKQIAYQLRVSPHTVHLYVKRLYRTFNVESRAELLCRFLDRGVINRLLGA